MIRDIVPGANHADVWTVLWLGYNYGLLTYDEYMALGDWLFDHEHLFSRVVSQKTTKTTCKAVCQTIPTIEPLAKS